MAKYTIDYDNPEILHRLIRSLIGSTPAAYIIMDRSYRIQFVNPYFLSLRKLSREEVIGHRCYDLINDGRPCDQCPVRTALETGQRDHIVRKDLSPDGSARYYDDYAIPLKDKNGEFEYVLDVMVNRTNEMLLRENNATLFADIIAALVSILDKKDSYTSTHSADVAEIGCKLGRRIGLRDEELYDLRLAGLLHDIGKVYIPDGIINKAACLTEEEYLQIKRHPSMTMEILKPFERFNAVSAIAGHHHERWDGKGYPDRLKGEEIPLGARILALADTYDAMTSRRPYRRAMRHDLAMRELYRFSGKQFDPQLTEVFLDMGTHSHFSRDELIARTPVPLPARNRKSLRAGFERRLTTTIARRAERIIDENVESLFLDNHMAKAIIDNSPGYYLVVDAEFNILYASDNVARDYRIPMAQLLNLRCYERSDKRMSCFKVENGVVTCPVVRAFMSGKAEQGVVTEEFMGEKHPCEIFAIPMELTAPDGENIPCVMEIIIDRTREMAERDTFHNDSRVFLDLLYKLVSNIDSATTQGGDDMVEECESFGGYLQKMQERMRRLTGTRRHRRDTAYA